MVNTKSAFKTSFKGNRIYYKEEGEFEQHYFSPTHKIYSDKLSKFVVRCNEKCNGEVIRRLSRIYSHIFIDEVQDLAGNDLEILKLFLSSNSNIFMVGDPRQVTYLTHYERLHSGYADGKIEQFILDKCKKNNCFVDKTTLQNSHRNNAQICRFSSKLYPSESVSLPCTCIKCRSDKIEHEGIFLVKKGDVNRYLEDFKPAILRYSESSDTDWNFGISKGLSFDRVLLYPSKTIVQYLKDGKLTKSVKIRNKKTRGFKIEIKDAFDIAKFYVAITRARYSVGIVCDYNNETFIEGVNKYNRDKNSDSLNFQQMLLF